VRDAPQSVEHAVLRLALEVAEVLVHVEKDAALKCRE